MKVRNLPYPFLRGQPLKLRQMFVLVCGRHVGACLPSRSFFLYVDSGLARVRSILNRVTLKSSNSRSHVPLKQSPNVKSDKGNIPIYVTKPEKQ